MKFSKEITALVTLVMLVSVIILIVPDASATASGSVTYSPSVFSAGVPTLTVASGGTFGSGSTVYFYLSSTTSSSGIIGSYIGYYTLSGGATTLNNAHFTVTIPSDLLGNYYILASDSSSPTSTSAQFTAPFSVKVVSITPSFSVSGTQPTTTATITGSGWDPLSSLSLYITGSDGTPLNYYYVSSFTTSSSGTLSSTFQIPSIPMNTYKIVLEETSGQNAGITADSQMSITPYISVSPFDINGLAGNVLTVTGYGFPINAKISAGMVAGGVTLSTPATTANSNGYFSTSGKLSSSITTTGPESLSLTYNTSSYSQANAFFVSSPNPTSLGFTFTSFNYVNSPFTATVYNFPASSVVTISLGGNVLGKINTDTNGYGTLSGSIPALPAGAYYPVAYSNGLFKTATEISISAYFEIIDTNGNLMTSAFNEYMPSGGTYTLVAYALTPEMVYSITDSGASTLSYKGSGVVSVSSGTYLGNLKFLPAENGTLMFKFMSVYSATTGTFEQVSLTYMGGIVSGFGSASYGYKAVGPISYSLSILSILTPLKTETLTVSNIIPENSNVYPGLNYLYNIYLGTTELSFTTTSGTTTIVKSSSSSSTSVTLTFTVPNMGNGVYNLSIVYNGQSTSNSIYSLPMIVSVEGTSYTSGALTVFEIQSQSSTTVYIAGYGYYGTSIYLYYMEFTGLYGPYTEPLTNGAFYYSFTLPSEPAGNYAVFTKAVSGTQTNFVYSSYAVSPELSLSISQGSIYNSITLTGSGLSANSYYNIYFGTNYMGSAISSSLGSLSAIISVPIVLPGDYSISIVQAGATTPAASSLFAVLPSTTISLSTGNYAFPGQIVQFTWAPASAPAQPSSALLSGTPDYGPVYVTVYLNNTPYTTFPAIFGTVSGVSVLNGSFIAPNAQPGSYWAVSFGWSQYVNKSSGHVNGYITYVGKSAMYFGLVSGNGALLTGISSSQIATVVAAVNNAVTTSMQVPLSELSANITALNGDIATITTAFGKMNATLQAINATVKSISNGVATVETDLGTVQTSLVFSSSNYIAQNQSG
jgi:hypothetical protein